MRERKSGILRRAGAITLLGMVVLLLATAPALAQFEDAEPDSARQAARAERAGLADTTGTDDSLDSYSEDGEEEEALFQALNPSYNTTYDVRRQTTEWLQDFSFGAGVGFLRFNNKTNFNVSTDNGRDEERRKGTNQTTLRLNLIKKLPISSNINIGRTSATRPNDVKETNDAKITINTNYGLKFLGIRHSLNGGGGYSFLKDVQDRNQIRSESKDAGFSGNLAWRGNWAFEFLTFTSNIRETRSSKTTELLRADEERSSKPTRNKNRTVSLTVKYNPLSWMRGDVAFNRTSGNDERFSASAGELERIVKRNNSVSATMNLTPFQNRVRSNWKLTTNNHDLSYRVAQNSASSGNGLSWEGDLKTDFLGVKIDGTLSSRRNIVEPATSAKTETQNNLFDTKLSRELSSKITARFNFLLRATKIFFTDDDPTRVLDRDELRTKIQPSLIYTPNGKWQVDASYIRSTNRRVEINPTRSAQTQDSEDFSVDIGINYTLSSKTRLSQNYSIQAVYTTFDFNPRSDRLLSTQRIVTNMDSKITPKVNLQLEHRFTLQDSGPFRFDPDGSRVFTRSLRKYRQELTAKLEYTVTRWLSLSTNSRFLRTDDVTEATGFRRITRDLNLQHGVHIRHDLGGATFSVNGQYRRSSVQEPYWTIKSNLSKEF